MPSLEAKASAVTLNTLTVTLFFNQLLCGNHPFTATYSYPIKSF